MRIILDTNVLVSAVLVINSPNNKVLERALKNEVVLLSVHTMDELIETLKKPKIRKYIPLSDAAVFIDKLDRKATYIEIMHVVNECRDPKDNKFLELALSGKADCIVSGDKDLLVLNPFRGIPIISAAEFLDKY